MAYQCGALSTRDDQDSAKAAHPERGLRTTTPGVSCETVRDDGTVAIYSFPAAVSSPGTFFGSYFAPAETWITVMRTLVGKNFS